MKMITKKQRKLFEDSVLEDVGILKDRIKILEHDVMIIRKQNERLLIQERQMLLDEEE